MKSEYRQAVESAIAQKAKLVEVTAQHGEAVANAERLGEAVKFNQETLDRYEERVSELERVDARTQRRP